MLGISMSFGALWHARMGLSPRKRRANDGSVPLKMAELLADRRGFRRGQGLAPPWPSVAEPAADLQMTLGLLLYLWLSPWSRAFFHNPRVGCQDSSLRFFGVEHVFGMLIAIALLHVGQERAQRRAAARDKRRQVFWFTLSALLLMAASVPWPFMPYPRPLIRGV